MGSKIALVQADIREGSELNKLIDVALVLSENGKIDIIVHNAAVGDDCYLEDVTEGI
jgi:3-oxoacyl-[acyl-carrier protein] reductase